MFIASSVLILLILLPTIAADLGKDKTRGNVLITGGCGFVGRHFVHRLCELGYSITIVDSMISESALPLSEWPNHLKPNESCPITFFRMDCREFFKTGQAEHGNVYYSIFIHLAAVVGGRAKIEGSPVAVADDLAIDAAAFIWATDTGNGKKMPEKMIYFSSSAAYPVKYQELSDHKILKESMIDLDSPNIDIAKPDLTYGWAKLTGEYLAKLSHQYYGLNISVYRPMSGYGEDQHEAYPFKSILIKALRRDNPISIWSDAVRDFIYIEDIVRCVLDSADAIHDANPINLATGIATKFSDLAKMMAKELGYDADVKVMSGMPTGVMYRVGDSMKEEGLPFPSCQAPHTTIQSGIKKAISFMKEKSDTVKNSFENSTDQSPLYSSFQCIGGSQLVGDDLWIFPSQTMPFPLYKPQFRSCVLKNVCWDGNKIQFFQDPKLYQEDSLLSHFIDAFAKNNSGFFYLGSGKEVPSSIIDLKLNELPIENFQFDSSNVSFLDANSNSYNYGHYLLDNVFSAFQASLVFNLPFTNSRHVFESSCKVFGMNTFVHSQAVPFDKSHSFRSLCLSKLNGWWSYFFDLPPLYLEPLYTKPNLCFRNLIIGHGYTFGLNTVEFSRGRSLRAFRDHVVKRIEAKEGEMQPQKRLILVGIRSEGHTGGEQCAGLCDIVKEAVKKLNSEYSDRDNFAVRCIINQNIGFIEEIKNVREAMILISVHGTISYMSLFARDGTQQIVLYDLNEKAAYRLKEHNILMYATHVNAIYHPWNNITNELLPLIRFAVKNIQVFGDNLESRVGINYRPNLFNNTLYKHAMLPVDGTLIRGHSGPENTTYVMKNGLKCLVPSRDILVSHGLDKNEPENIPYHEFISIKNGDPLN